MASRQEYADVARQVLAPHWTDASTAWRGLYQLLMWFDRGVPHIIDGDKLARGRWRERAEAVHAALAKEFQCAADEVPNEVDLLLRSSILANHLSAKTRWESDSSPDSLCCLSTSRRRINGLCQRRPSGVPIANAVQGLTRVFFCLALTSRLQLRPAPGCPYVHQQDEKCGGDDER